jgi:large subunit ribosomal protein L35
MPKMKTHSGAKKRFKKTGKGKIMHEQANNQHMYEQKSSRRKRRLDIEQTLSPGDNKIIKRLLGQR